VPEVPEMGWRVFLYCLAAVGAGGCVFLLWTRRKRGVISPTRVFAALSAGLLAYHAAAYASPVAWFPLRVPRENAWLVLVLIGAGLAASAWMDRRQAAEAQSRAGGPDSPNP